jgi:hypothetical protein
MSETTITAYLPDGRHIDVPKSDAQDWSSEAADLDTTLGLADWYTEQGDERHDEIHGVAADDPRCEHLHSGPDGTTPVNLKRIIVVNKSQAGKYDPALPHAAASVCDARSCILDAMAWVERAAGERAVWIDDARIVHELPLMLEIITVHPAKTAPKYPLDQPAAQLLMDEDGYATLTIDLDKGAFLKAVASRELGRDIEDFVHDQVLSFGVSYNSTVEAVAITGQIITVEYTTSIAAAIESELDD